MYINISRCKINRYNYEESPIDNNELFEPLKRIEDPYESGTSTTMNPFLFYMFQNINGPVKSWEDIKDLRQNYNVRN